MQAFFCWEQSSSRDILYMQYLQETKIAEHASNSGLVAFGIWNQGLYPFDVLCVACRISAAFEDRCTTCILLGT